MKAVLEMEAPKSCLICPFDGWSNEDTSKRKCYAWGQEHESKEYKKERAPFCPLKIVDEEEEAIYKNDNF